MNFAQNVNYDFVAFICCNSFNDTHSFQIILIEQSRVTSTYTWYNKKKKKKKKKKGITDKGK